MRYSEKTLILMGRPAKNVYIVGPNSLNEINPLGILGSICLASHESCETFVLQGRRLLTYPVRPGKTKGHIVAWKGKKMKTGKSIVLMIVLIGMHSFASGDFLQQTETSLLTARDQFTGGVIDGKIYVFGGNGNPNGRNLKSTEMFDPATDVWTSRVDNNHNDSQGVEELTGAVVDEKLYVFGAWGGVGPSGFYGDINFNEVYDPVANTWTTLAPKPTLVTGAPSTVYNGEVYIFGGGYSHEGLEEQNIYDVVEAYNPATNTWRSVTNMPKKLQMFALATVGNKAYIMGGYLPDEDRMSEEVITFDFETGQWDTDSYEPFPTDRIRGSRYSSAAPVVGGRIFLVGGMEANNADDSWASNKVDIYDTTTNTWHVRTSLPVPLYQHLTVVLEDRIYVIGGCSDYEDTNRSKSEVYSIPIGDIDVQVSIQKCKAKAGKTVGKDSISFTGTMEDITADGLNGAGEIYITIVSDVDGHVPYHIDDDPLIINPAKVKKGKYSHKDKQKGISFKIDTNKAGKFSLKIKNADLTGLGSPLTLEIAIGSYNGAGSAGENTVNGPKKSIPIQLMSGYKDTLPPPLKIKAKNGKKEFTDSLAVKGGFSLKDEPGPITSMTLFLGDQPFDLTDGKGAFTYKRDKKTSKITSVAYKTKKGETPQIKAKFDFVKCSYSVSIKKAGLDTTSGKVDFGVMVDMATGSFNQSVKVDLD